jgi:hypothetical protein
MKSKLLLTIFLMLATWLQGQNEINYFEKVNPDEVVIRATILLLFWAILATCLFIAGWVWLKKKKKE